MKKLLTLACLLLGMLQAEAQISQNMSKLSSWRHPDQNRYYNDCWGYAANGREYAILGSNWGTHFFDITNPANPVEINSFPGNDTDVIWRDFKTNGHYAYGVADGGNNSLQIFDLSGLPGTITKVYDSQALTVSTHNLYIDNNRLYLCSNSLPGQGTRSVDIVSIANPVNPVFLSTLQLPNSVVHDAYVRNDTAYLSGEYPGLYIYNLANPANPQPISSINQYPSQGYNHSNWTTADAKTLVFADEVPDGLPLKIFDISNISTPLFKSTFQSSVGATPHNPYIIGDHVIISYYMDGVQVFNISDLQNPVRVGYYDTYPDNTDFSGNPYEGCWGVYPFLPSGNIIASDITYGLFVLSPPYGINSAPESVLEQQVKISPNPASGHFSVQLPAGISNPSFVLINAVGQQVAVPAQLSENNTYTLNTAGLSSGIYMLQARSGNMLVNKKLVIK